MQELDDQHVATTFNAVFTNLRNGKLAAAKEQADYLSSPSSYPFTRWLSGIVYAIDADYDRARELMLSAEPGYAHSDQWARLLDERQQDACVIAWVFMNSGDDVLGLELLTHAVSYLEEELPQYIAHADRYSSAICHAALGDIDASLAAMQKTVTHNHIDPWWWIRLWPAFRPLLDDPRFVALDQQVTDELARQRAIIEAIAAEQGAGP